MANRHQKRYHRFVTRLILSASCITSMAYSSKNGRWRLIRFSFTLFGSSTCRSRSLTWACICARSSFTLLARESASSSDKSSMCSPRAITRLKATHIFPMSILAYARNIAARLAVSNSSLSAFSLPKNCVTTSLKSDTSACKSYNCTFTAPVYDFLQHLVAILSSLDASSV